MDNFKNIRSAIKTAIDNQIGKKIKESWNYERSTFSGFPAAIIVPTNNEADYGSTAKDKLTFVFKIRSYYIIENEESHSEAEVALEEVIDQLLSLFRDRDVLGSACDWVEPAPSVWEYEERGEAVYRVAEITLKCIKYL